MIYTMIYKVQELIEDHEQQKRISRADQEEAGRKKLRTIYRWSSTLSLC